MTAPRPLSWFEIVRLGLVQASFGAIVVLMTATLNRVMVVELALFAMLPGALVGLHYAIQISRPRWGHGSDSGGRRTPWIIGGMAVLAVSGILAVLATVWIETAPVAGIGLAILAYALIGGGVGAAGTSLLALLATDVAKERRAAASAVTWIMMIAGFVITTASVGKLLTPFSMTQLVIVCSSVCAIAFAVSVIAVWGVERPRAQAVDAAGDAQPHTPFMVALKDAWGDTKARRFTIFVFVAMMAYSASDLILEPFAGLVFNMDVGPSTTLASMQQSGVLIGMIFVAVLGNRFGSDAGGFGRRQTWVVGGCVAATLALLSLAVASLVGPGFPLEIAVFALGLATGGFAVAAIGTMMGLAGADGGGREGMRIGLWGAAQAIAFGLGGFLGAAAIDAARAIFADAAPAFAIVFAVDAALFLLAAHLALRVDAPETRDAPTSTPLAETTP
jgi:BCD family chlorophyll transporter-like MFS transporter